MYPEPVETSLTNSCFGHSVVSGAPAVTGPAAVTGPLALVCLPAVPGPPALVGRQALALARPLLLELGTSQDFSSSP